MEQKLVYDTHRRNEWPITHFWYSQKVGKTIEEIIDTDPSFMVWALENFQNVTPKQAEYYKKKTGKTLPARVIQDVEPYDHQKGDPEKLYTELCQTQDLEGTLKKYRFEQLNLFDL